MEESLLQITENLGEIALDEFLEPGILKDIPIVGTIFSVIKITRNIQDRIFVEKLKVFIDNVETNKNWKKKFSNESECKKISKRLLYIIESSDDDDKIKLIAYIFNKYVNQEIDREDFFCLNSIVERSFYEFLKKITAIKDDSRDINNSQDDMFDVKNHYYT